MEIFTPFLYYIINNNNNFIFNINFYFNFKIVSYSLLAYSIQHLILNSPNYNRVGEREEGVTLTYFINDDSVYSRCGWNNEPRGVNRENVTMQKTERGVLRGGGREGLRETRGYFCG